MLTLNRRKKMFIIFGMFLLFPRLGTAAPLTQGPTSAAGTTTTVNVKTVCPQYYYLDHGTDLCEFCCDICCNAKHWGTTVQCEANCAEYAQKLRDEAALKMQENVQKLRNNGNPEDSTTGTLPPAAKIAIPVLGTLLFLLLVLLILVKRKAIVGMFRQQAPATQDLEDAEPLQGQQDGLADMDPQIPLPRAGIQDGLPDMGPQLTLPGAAIQNGLPDMDPQIALPRAGIQESERAGEGNSWRILSSLQSAVLTSELGEPRTPMQVSREGHLGLSDMELPMRALRRDNLTERNTIGPAQSCV